MANAALRPLTLPRSNVTDLRRRPTRQVARDASSSAHRPCRFVTLVALAATMTLAACGGDAPPVEVSVLAACAEENAKRTVIVEGYLRLPETISVSDTAVIDLWSLTGGSGDTVSVEFSIGDAPNQLRKPPENFSITSLRVITRGGKEVTIRDRVRLTATPSTGDGACRLTQPDVQLIAN